MKNIPFLIFLCLFSFPLFANNDFTIENYHVEISISEDGIIHVKETLDINFHKKMRGIYRDIETEGNFVSHVQKLTLSNINVENYKFKVEKKSGKLRIRIGDADTYIKGRHQYEISFTATNGILNFENHEEFYWNFISPEWKQKILNASFEITLPKAISLSDEDMRIFAGFDKEDTSYGKIWQEGNKVKGNALIELGKGSGISASFKVPNGYFLQSAFNTQNTSTEEESQKHPKDKSYPIPIILIGALLWTFFKKGRNQSVYKHQEVHYPPDDMSPAEVGTFYDHTVNNRDVLSMIPYWGQQGYLRMRAFEESSNSDLYLEKRNELPVDRPRYEHSFFNRLFKENDFVFVTDLKHKFYKDYGEITNMIKKEALDPPHYDIESIKIFHSWPILMFSLISIALGIFSMIKFSAIFTGIGLILLGLTAFIIYFLPPKKSELGIELKHNLKSFKSCLENSDEEILNKIITKDPKYFEKVFPYAVAFGIDKNFTKKFKDLSSKAPEWYYYENGRQATYDDFHRDLAMEDIGKTMSTPPVADKGSSSFNRRSGGGSVGGGFGGGGGGGW